MKQIRTYVLVGTAALGVMAATGCDDQVAQSAAARAALGEAIELVNEAEQGFAPEGTDYSAYRMDLLGQAETKLDAVMGQGSPAVMAGAHKLQSDVKVSLARGLTDQATDAFASINGQSTGLFNHLGAVEHINSIIVARTGDPRSILEALEEGEAQNREMKAGITASIAEVSAMREAATVNAEKYNAEASDYFTQAQEFEQLALDAANDEQKQAAYRQDYQAQLKGQSAQRKALEEQIQTDRLAEELASLRAASELRDQIAQQIVELRERVQREGADAAGDASAATSQKRLAVAGVQEQFDGLAKDYQDKVETPLNSAATQARAAIEQLEKAIKVADRDAKASLQIDLVAAQVELTRILATHVGYAGDFAKITNAFAANPAIAGTTAAGSFGGQQTRFETQAQTLADEAKGVIAQGIEKADAMGEDETFKSLAQALRSYGSRLN